MVRVIVRDIARGINVADFQAAPAHVAIIHIEKRQGETVLYVPGVDRPVILGQHFTVEIHNLTKG